MDTGAYSASNFMQFVAHPLAQFYGGLNTAGVKFVGRRVDGGKQQFQVRRRQSANRFCRRFRLAPAETLRL